MDNSIDGTAIESLSKSEETSHDKQDGDFESRMHQDPKFNKILEFLKN